MLNKPGRMNSQWNRSQRGGVVAALGCLALSFCVETAADAAARTIEHDRSEAAMIVAWNGAGRPWPLDECFAAPPRANPAYLQIQGDDAARFHFDAVHRRLLVRFPGLAERIHALLAAGHAVERVELVLEWANQDVEVPSGGYASQGRARDVYRADPGQWSVVAAALRRPWEAHPEHGPTWNSPVRGAGYWKRHGARDTGHDRYPTRFGPTPLHAEARTARLDVTETLTDPVYGATPAERLRRLERQGFILRKHETWEPKYGEVGSSYDWFVATGGHAIYIDPPKLVIHLAEDAGADPGALPPAVDSAARAAETAADSDERLPTWMPDERIQEDLNTRALRQPEDMPDWQWQRVLEVRSLGQARAPRPESVDEFIAVCNGMLSRPPRWYMGAGVQDWILFERRYGDLIPPHVRDHLANWWEAWLIPHYTHEQLVHPQGADDERLKEGRASFYRGFTRRVSTVGFNHRSTEGALFGGTFLERLGIDARNPLEDARWALDNLLMRYWVFRDGSMQDMISGHYTALHISFQVMFALYGPEWQDRLKGRIMLDNTLELPISAYHPGLRRIVYTGNRSFPDQVFLTQEGLYYILHTLSRQGALIHLDTGTPTLHGMAVFGSHFPGDRVARMSPLQPPHVVNMVDDKPLPYRITAADSVRGMFTDPPLLQRVYLGSHYALSSQDLSHGLLPVLAQWRREPKTVETMDAIGSLVAKFDANDTALPTPGGGYAQRTRGEGALVTFQHDNMALVVATPGIREDIMAAAGDDGLHSLQATIGVYSFQDTPGWEIMLDGQPVAEFPATARAGQRIAIRDGVSYIGIIPIAATDLGRDVEIEIDYAFPCLQIRNYNLRRAEAVDPETLDWDAVTRAYGGFVIELGDSTEHASFAAFREHLAAVRLTTEWDAKNGLLQVDYVSGDNHLEMGVRTHFRAFPNHYPVAPGTAGDVIPYRRRNGQWPYLPEGIVRDTTLTIQGDAGRLEKKGAVLEGTPGRMMYLAVEPLSGTTVGYNTLPDASRFRLVAPEGVEVLAEGALGLARVAVEPAAGRLVIEHLPLPDAPEGEAEAAPAQRLLVTGLEAMREVVLNGQSVTHRVEREDVAGRPALVIPLRVNDER